MALIKKDLYALGALIALNPAQLDIYPSRKRGANVYVYVHADLKKEFDALVLLLNLTPLEKPLIGDEPDEFNRITHKFLMN